MDNAPLHVAEKTGYQKFSLSSLRSTVVFFWLYNVARVTLSVIFIWSGISKLFNPESFAVIIEAYGLIPDIMLMPAAILLPLVEVIAGVGLILNIQGSLTLITIMMLLFMAILFYGIWLGFDIDCGCFGPEDPESKAFHGLSTALLRDVWLLVGITYLYLYRYFKSLKPLEVRNIVGKFKDNNRRNWVK